MISFVGTVAKGDDPTAGTVGSAATESIRRTYMNDRSRMMLYTLTCLACVIWLWQSAKDALADGTLSSAPTVILLVCIGIAAIYCGINALMLWWSQPGSDDDDARDERDKTDDPESPKAGGGSAIQ